MALTCAVPECGVRGPTRLCPKHYQRLRTHGDVNYVYVKPTKTPYERVMAKTTEVGDCWVYRGNNQRYGHGLIKVGSRVDGTMTNKLTHRVVYEALVGPIPEGLHLDHLCRNPPCVNPAHLEPVTPAENTRRGFAARRQLKEVSA